MSALINVNTSQQDIQDISFNVIRKKRFRIDGDDNRILELNTSDLNILTRLKETYPKLLELAQTTFKDLPEVDSQSDDYDFLTDNATGETIDRLKEADQKMRELVDYIFNSNVSELCADGGSMYDPINGGFRFEHIINVLAALYESEISSEMGKVANRVKKYTNKYTG